MTRREAELLAHRLAAVELHQARATVRESPDYPTEPKDQGYVDEMLNTICRRLAERGGDYLWSLEVPKETP